MTEGYEVHSGKMVGDIAQRPADIVLRDAEFVGDILRELADIELAVHHNDAHQGGGEEVRHVVIDACQLSDLSLILGVDGIEFFIDRLQLLVGALQLFIGREQLLIGRLELRVYGLQLCDCVAEVVL